PNNCTRALHHALAESHAYHLLAFHPSPAEPGERKLKVRVRREGLTVRAPARYLAGEPATGSRPIPPAVQALGAVSDATDIPLRVSTLFLDASAIGEVPTTVAAELEKDAAVSGERHLNLLVEAHPLDRGEPVRDTSELSVPSGGRAAVA